MPVCVVGTNAVIFEMGRTAGLNGRRRDSCPYPHWMAHAQAWLEGWVSVASNLLPEDTQTKSESATTRFLRLAETGMPALTMARRLKMEIDEVHQRLRAEGLQQRKIVWLKTGVCWRDYERLHLDTRLNAGQFLPVISREMGRRRNDLNGRLNHMSRRGWSSIDRDRLGCLQAANAGLEIMVLELDRTSQAIAAEIARSAASVDRCAQIGRVGELP